MTKQPFRPRARLLQLMGDQLIGNSRLALFELVKNAYDADATKANVLFRDLGKANATIIVVDDGEGMSLDTLQKVWLEPGADFREQQRTAGRRSKKFGRLPLGEKGVGRFAVQKLGNQIKLVTRAAGQPEFTIDIDWTDLVSNKQYMDETAIEIKETRGDIFKKDETGTRIEITELRDEWTRGDVRRLWNNVQSISSPFHTKEAFTVNLDVADKKEWVKGLPSAKKVISKAFWVYDFSFENGKFEWNYEFRAISELGIEGRKEQSEKDATLKLPKDQDGAHKFGIIGDNNLSQDIGPVHGKFYVFDRDRDVLDIITNHKTLTDYLDENGGVRVYRDGIRVHNYGEKGIDWLGLDLRRVNIPTKRISNNIIIGAIDLSLAESPGLKEKTNREGFNENDAYERFRTIVLAALMDLETHREGDKKQIKGLMDHKKGRSVLDLEKPLEELRKALKKEKVGKHLDRYVDSVEKKFHDMKEVVARAGVANISLALAFHEIERIVKGLNASIKENKPQDFIKKQISDLNGLLDGFSILLRNDNPKEHDLKSVVEESLFLNSSRIDYHNVILSSPLVSGEQKSTKVIISLSKVLGALSNVIDNSLYWMRTRWPDNEYGKGGKAKRALYIGVSDYFKEGPAVVIADNGPGIQIPLIEAVKPFLTTKPDGMGLGLYYTGMVMELLGGKLVFPDPQDVGVPKGYDGAVIALVFKKAT